MRRVRYGVAMSLDGYIAGPNGEYDWITMDPEIPFAELLAEFDTLLIGRKTFDAMNRMKGAGASMPGVQSIVFSRTLTLEDYAGVVIERDAVRTVAELRTRPGKDIAIFGGGDLFRSLLAAGQVDGVAVSLMPVLLGAGIPLLATPADRARLKLRSHRVYSKTGILGLEYDIVRL